MRRVVLDLSTSVGSPYPKPSRFFSTSSALIDGVFWGQAGGRNGRGISRDDHVLIMIVPREVLQDAHIERSQLCFIFKVYMAFVAVFLELGV